MDRFFEKLEELGEEIKEYSKTRISLLKLSAAEKSSKLAGLFVARMIIAVLFLVALLFASFAFVYVLAEWTGELYWGFLIMAGIYAAAGFIVLYAVKNRIREKTADAVIYQLFKEEENNGED